MTSYIIPDTTGWNRRRADTIFLRRRRRRYDSRARGRILSRFQVTSGVDSQPLRHLDVQHEGLSDDLSRAQGVEEHHGAAGSHRARAHRRREACARGGGNGGSSGSTKQRRRAKQGRAAREEEEEEEGKEGETKAVTPSEE